jgi:dTDP-4-dehydrorhamnose reductase
MLRQNTKMVKNINLAAMKKLLVTGASGFLGWNLCRSPQKEWDIVGSYHQHLDGLYPGTKGIQLDLLDANQVRKTIEEIKPDAVLHLAANSSTGFCEKHPEISRKINVEATGILAQYCQAKSIPLVFTSSSQVYDGRQLMYTDATPCNPINAYGQQKVTAEKIIQQCFPEAAIARIALLFGHQGPTAYCFMTVWLAKWETGEEVTVFYDEVRSFLSGNSAVEALLLLLRERVSGVYNVGGADAMSRYDFAKLLSKTFGFENARIKKMSRLDIPGGDKRPASLILGNEGMKGLGFKPRLIAEELSLLTR